MKKIMSFLMVAVLSLALFAGCAIEETTPTSSADQKEAEITKQITQEAANRVGMPNISNFYEKQMLKDIYELRDDSSLVTYTYTTNLEGKYIFLFKSIGYGLPMSVQYSNPQIIGTVDGGEYGARNPYSKPQPEPNGLFMPEGLSATWVMKIKDDGTRTPVYVEQEIFVTQEKLPRRLCAEWSLPEDY